MDEGVDGLLRDKTRPPRVPKLADQVADRIVALTLVEPPSETIRWTGRMMAKAAGVSLTVSGAAAPRRGSRLRSAADQAASEIAFGA